MAQKGTPRIFVPLSTDKCDATMNMGFPIPYKDGKIQEGDWMIGGLKADGSAATDHVLMNIRMENPEKDMEALIVTLMISPIELKKAIQQNQPDVLKQKKEREEKQNNWEARKKEMEGKNSK
jgi:hypothetical protein